MSQRVRYRCVRPTDGLFLLSGVLDSAAGDLFYPFREVDVPQGIEEAKRLLGTEGLRKVSVVQVNHQDPSCVLVHVVSQEGLESAVNLDPIQSRWCCGKEGFLFARPV